MAEADLIAAYLNELQPSLRWQRTADLVALELEDHLRESAARRTALGVDSDTAQRETLHQFGEPHIVALAFNLNSRGDIAMPTQFTRAAGTSALIAAGLWIAAAVAALWGQFDMTEVWSDEIFPYFMALVIAALLCTLFTVAGTLTRTGGGRDPLTISALVLGGISVLVMGAMPWTWVGSALPLTVAALLVTLRLRTNGLGSPAHWLLVAAWPLGSATLVLMEALRVGPVDRYGDYPAAWHTGFSLAVALFALGLFSIGRWLRSEEPAVVPGGAATA